MFFIKQLSLMIISMCLDCNYIALRHCCTVLILKSFKIVLPTFLDSITFFCIGIGECTFHRVAAYFEEKKCILGTDSVHTVGLAQSSHNKPTAKLHTKPCIQLQWDFMKLLQRQTVKLHTFELSSA